MQVRAADIARTLGISKSTVSLALNNKPGVNENTRKKIFECRERLMNSAAAAPDTAGSAEDSSSRRQVMVLRISNGMKNIIEPELDLWSDVNAEFERNLALHNYSMGIMYLDFRRSDYVRMYSECNKDFVAGVIIFGTEVVERDLDKIRGIHKPLVIYDCPLPTADYPTVMINNKQGIELAIDELWSNGNKDIIFLNNSMPMFNYKSRTEGFISQMRRRGTEDAEKRVVLTESSIDGVYRFMKKYLEAGRLPQAFLTGSYHVTVGLISALQEAGIRVPEDVSIVGIDEIPRYMAGGLDLTCIRVPHTERAYWTIQMLFKEIDAPVQEKSRLYTDCVLVKGGTVKRRHDG